VKRGTIMKSLVVKRSIVRAGHKTSVSLEDEFWNALKDIAGDRHVTLSELVGGIDAQRQHGNLSSALRLFVLDFYRGKAAEKLRQRNARRRLSATHARTFLSARSGGRRCSGKREHQRPALRPDGALVDRSELCEFQQVAT
jgi:predicted DNA-binding ribbon-helix-helix protein